MKILLIGRTGQLGIDILRNNARHEIYAPDRADFDICSRNAVKAVVDDYKPEVVINTVSFHDVPLCALIFLNFIAESTVFFAMSPPKRLILLV